MKLQFIGLFFLILSALSIFRAAKKTKAIKKSCIIKIKATIVQNEFQTNKNFTFYSPTYEYEIDGVKKYYTSPYSSPKPLAVGTTMDLYYDQNNEQIIESGAPIIENALAVVFAGFAIILIMFANFA
jgi:hypothetical protein